MDLMFLNGNNVKGLSRIVTAPFPLDTEVEYTAEDFPCIILLLIRFEGLGDHLPAIFRRELREQCHSEIRAAFADASGYVADLCKCTFPTLLNVLFHFQQP